LERREGRKERGGNEDARKVGLPKCVKLAVHSTRIRKQRTESRHPRYMSSEESDKYPPMVKAAPKSASLLN
jgi:hypothetical protein